MKPNKSSKRKRIQRRRQEQMEQESMAPLTEQENLQLLENIMVACGELRYVIGGMLLMESAKTGDKDLLRQGMTEMSEGFHQALLASEYIRLAMRELDTAGGHQETEDSGGS